MSQNEVSKNFYNKWGFYFFLITLSFSCLWAMYFLVVKNTMDLGEYDGLSRQTQTTLTENLSLEEQARTWISTDN